MYRFVLVLWNRTILANEPAMGLLISLSKCQGQQTLYGHSFVNEAFIRLKISEARQFRSFQEYTYSAGKVILEARLSFSQFAELITSFNIGDGVPATLHRLGKTTFDSPTIEDETVAVKQEGYAELQAAIAEIDKAIAVTKEQKMSKKAEQAILQSLHSARSKLKSNLPCVQKFFEERIDKIQSDARIEIASFLALAIEKNGLESLQGSQQLFFSEALKD